MTRAQNTIAATRTIRLVVGAGRVPGHPHCYGARICLNHKENNVRYASIAQSTRHCVRPCACECEWKCENRTPVAYLLIDELATDLTLESVHVDIDAVHAVRIGHVPEGTPTANALTGRLTVINNTGDRTGFSRIIITALLST